jgi:hypothetical protein
MIHERLNCLATEAYFITNVVLNEIGEESYNKEFCEATYIGEEYLII